MMDCLPPAPLCRLLAWDTEFFGFPIARVLADRMTEAELPLILDWCAGHHIRCLYLLASAADPDTARIAAAPPFRFVDIRTTLECALSAAPDLSPQPASVIRPARPGDAGPLGATARVSHTDSRFYWDPGFPREKCAELYQTWIEKSIHGDAQAVLVAEHNSQPAGYVTCDWTAGTGHIGLIAVAPEARGCGLGSALIHSALCLFKEKHVERVTVVTQGRNVSAQRLYQRHGFLTSAVEIWYHAWLA